MARKLFSPIAKGKSVTPLYKKPAESSEVRDLLMQKISLLNEILSYGYEEAIEGYDADSRRFMAAYKGKSTKEIMAALKTLEQKLYEL